MQPDNDQRNLTGIQHGSDSVLGDDSARAADSTEITHRDRMLARHPFQYGYRFQPIPREEPARLGVLSTHRWVEAEDRKDPLTEGAFGDAAFEWKAGEPLSLGRRWRRALTSKRYPTRTYPGLIPLVG